MPLKEIVIEALASLRAGKLRSLLTMLGIIIGVASVIAMVALGNGAEASVKARIAQLGTTVLQINPQRVNQGGVSSATNAKLTTRDGDTILARSPNVHALNWQVDRRILVVRGNRNAIVQVTGTSSNFMEVRGFRLAAGEMFRATDDVARRKIAVLGADVLAMLDIADPSAIIGEPIRIAGRQFTVIGVMAQKGTNAFGDADEQILIPYSTGRFEVFGTDRINDMWALVGSEDSMTVAMAEIQAAIRRSHRLRRGSPNDFSIRNQADVLSILSETTQTFTLLLAGIAAVSLMVGGIGIMNIMLVSVTERTREIGIRKALGATRANILLQFLIEAIVLCLLGGAFGVIVGVGTSLILRQAFGWQTAIDGPSIAVAFAFSGAVGLLFGVWPARRAAVMVPVEALRYE